MQRRTWLKWFAGVLVASRTVKLRGELQAPTDLTDANIATLHAIADVVLPASIGEDGRRAAINRFVGWIRNYKEDADRGHGYGASTLSAPTGRSPARQYPAQCAAALPIDLSQFFEATRGWDEAGATATSDTFLLVAPGVRVSRAERRRSVVVENRRVQPFSRTDGCLHSRSQCSPPANGRQAANA